MVIVERSFTEREKYFSDKDDERDDDRGGPGLTVVIPTPVTDIDDGDDVRDARGVGKVL